MPSLRARYLWLTAALGAIAVGWFFAHPVRTPLVTGVLLLVLTCFLPPLAVRVPVISPGTVYAVMTLMTFAIGALAWFGHPTSSPPGVTQVAVGHALMLVSLAVASFWAGYFLSRPPSVHRIEGPTRIVSVGALWLVMGVGVLADLVLLRTGQFGYLRTATTALEATSWAQWVVVVSGLTNIALFLAAIHAIGNRSKSHLRAMIGMLIVTSILGLISGFKGYVFWPLVWVLFIFVLYRRQFPWKLVVPAAALMFVLVPANLLYRNEVRTSMPTGVGGAVRMVQQAASITLNTPVSARTDTLVQWVGSRFGDITSVAAIQLQTPVPYPYLGAGDYLRGPAVVFVPRFLWPSKPVLDLGYVFGQRYLGLPAGYLTSIPVTNVGDLYMHLGLTGVVVGMLLLGVVAGLLFRWIRRRDSAAAILVFVVALTALTNAEADMVLYVSDAFRTVLMALVAVRVLFGPGALAVTNVPNTAGPRSMPPWLPRTEV